ncbi:hypothetical protein B0H13DRAFT_2037422 [Mycena leptocephala]|nr:hypothetical protein B0H13DRAFT_2037422 [Mycena leptocephala]
MISPPQTGRRPMDLLRDTWPPYAQSRNIDNFNSPWLPSPDSFIGHNAALPRSKTVRNAVEMYAATRQTTPGRNIGRLFRSLCGFNTCANQYNDDQKFKQIAHVPLSQWRAFAAYSRPTVNGVDVHNTFTPSPTPYRTIDLDEIDPEEVFASLRSPSGNIHPERWIRGLQHPSLPPPPTDWPLTSPSEPLPFPWECELNPFLKPAVCGPAPVYWNIRSGKLAILYGGPNDVSIPLSQPDLAQPATRPLVTHMYINGVACTDAGFPWKSMVVNSAGICVRDVFNAIMDNFQHYVFRSEYQKWSQARQKRAELEWALRGGPETQDGLRRLDYLCGQLCFRGLEPSRDRTGWVLYVGSEW